MPPTGSIKLCPLNQSRAATLKVLIDNREAITDALIGNDLSSVEIIPA